MVTRKAILAAFELIVNDPNVRRVIYFCFRDGQDIDAITGVSVRRYTKPTHDSTILYEAELGGVSNADRKWFALQTTKDGVSPKFYIDYFPGRQ